MGDCCLRHNGTAIYGTGTESYYQDGRTFFTAGKDGRYYAIVLLEESETVPALITWRHNLPEKGSSIRLTTTNQKVRWKKNGDSVSVSVPPAFRKQSQSSLVFSFDAGK